MPSRLDARNTSSFTSRGAASASIQIFSAYPFTAAPESRSSQLRIHGTLGLELANEIARFSPQELPGGTHVDLCPAPTEPPRTWIGQDPGTRLRRQARNSCK